MKHFDINTKVKVLKKKKVIPTWNQKLNAKGIASWSQSLAALKKMIPS